MNRPTNTPTTSSSDKHDPYAAFRFYNYRLFLSGWLIAMIGTRIQSVAIGWEMYQRTGEALSLGLVGLAQALPTMIFAIPAGYLADNFSRRKLMMFSLFGMTGTSITLALLSFGQGPVNLMYLFLFLDATAVVLGRPARTAILPNLVPSHVFPNAVTWNMSLMQLTAVLGPAIGGFIVALNVPAAYVCSAFSSVIFIILLRQLTIPPITKRAGAATLQTVLGGIQFVRRSRIILALMSLDMFAVLLGGAVYLLPIFADDILNVGAEGFGWLRSAPAAGAFCTAITLAYLPPIKRAGRTLLWAVAGFGLATIVFGLSTWFWLSFGMLFLTGALDNISMVIRHTLVQLLTPDHMRGRVSAVNSIFVGASNELGGLESGLVAHWFGPIFSVVSGGVGTLIVVALTALAAPGLRAYGALNKTQPIEDSQSEPQEEA